MKALVTKAYLIQMRVLISEDLPHIFERFYQTVGHTHLSGTGLGSKFTIKLPSWKKSGDSV